MKDLKEVNLGEEIQGVVKEVTQQKINKYAEASGDFNPLHIDPEFAKNTRFHGTIAHGLLTLAYISQMMYNWAGARWFGNSSIEVSFLAPVMSGDLVVAKGVVKEKRDDGSVICEVCCENEKGTKVIAGKATVLF